MKIVVKVGTGVLTRENGTLDGSSIVHLVSALADLMQQGHQVVLVSSGAVGAGFPYWGFRPIRRSCPSSRPVPRWGRRG